MVFTNRTTRAKP